MIIATNQLCLLHGISEVSQIWEELSEERKTLHTLFDHQ